MIELNQPRMPRSTSLCLFSVLAFCLFVIVGGRDGVGHDYGFQQARFGFQIIHNFRQGDQEAYVEGFL